MTAVDLTAGRDETAWLAWRAAGITATDVAAAATGSYGGAYSVIARKLGLEPVEQTEQMTRGHRWQAPIADAVHALTGYHVVGEEAWLEHADDPRWRCTPDGFLAHAPEVDLADVAAGLEVKTVGEDVRPAWDYYRAQAQWQAFVADLPRVLLAVATIRDATDELVALRLVWVDADPMTQEVLRFTAEDLWAHYTAGTLPDPTGPGVLDSVKAVNRAADVDLPAVDLSDLDADLDRREELRVAAAAARSELAELDARIRHRVGAATAGVSDRWDVKVSRPAQELGAYARAQLVAARPDLARVDVDVDRLKAEAPDLYRAHRTFTGSRRLSIRPRKDQHR